MTPHDEIQAAGPVRTCIGCRERAAKSELLRVVAGEGTVVPDPDGSAPGRGAHLHPTPACFELAERKRAFTRALRHDAAGSGGALDLGGLISGAVLTETVFAWSGMGALFVQALNRVDLNPLMGFFLVTAITVIVFNFLADVVYSALDPRIRVTA